MSRWDSWLAGCWCTGFVKNLQRQTQLFDIFDATGTTVSWALGEKRAEMMETHKTARPTAKRRPRRRAVEAVAAAERRDSVIFFSEDGQSVRIQGR